MGQRGVNSFMPENAINLNFRIKDTQEWNDGNFGVPFYNIFWKVLLFGFPQIIKIFAPESNIYPFNSVFIRFEWDATSLSFSG